jgi:hypothetical protein
VPSGGRPREEWRATERDEPGDGDVELEFVRDKRKDAVSPRTTQDLPRYRVIAHDPNDSGNASVGEPDETWETWEEPL